MSDSFPQTYAAMSDDELLNVATHLDQLVPEAQSALLDELRRRNLSKSDIERAYKDADESKRLNLSESNIERTYKDAAATVRKWREFKRKTGEWPLFSIAASTLQITVLVLGGGFLIWYSERHGWSRGRFGLTLLAMLFPYMILCAWLKDKIYFAEIQHARHRRDIKL